MCVCTRLVSLFWRDATCDASFGLFARAGFGFLCFLAELFFSPSLLLRFLFFSCAVAAGFFLFFLRRVFCCFFVVLFPISSLLG